MVIRVLLIMEFAQDQANSNDECANQLRVAS